MKELALYLTMLFLLTFGCTNEKKECIEIKYLDFFSLEKTNELNWSESELNQLIKMDFATNKEDRINKTNFLIPQIMLQLKSYYPECENLSKNNQFSKLVQLYFKIRRQNKSLLMGKTISEQIEYIREDFYNQVLNDTLLPYMNYSTDDGPLYGQKSKGISKFENIKSIETDFGKLSIIKSQDKFYITAHDKHNRILWTRFMTGIDGNALNKISFSDKPIKKTSRAFIVNMTSGEELTLYLNLSGKFMYYFYSW